MALQSKVVVYAAIGGLVVMMGGFVFYASLDNPELEQVTVDLGDVRVVSNDRVSGTLRIETTFMVSNPSDKTFTVPSIAYDLLVGQTTITSGQYSTEDIAMPGRAAFYPGATIPLKSITTVAKGDVDAGVYDSLADGGGLVDVHARGMIAAESAWSVIEKEFDTGT